MSDKVLAEAKRLYKEGWAVIWLKPKQKRPVESGWTTGPRTPWKELVASYAPGMNVGVRLGEVSRVNDGYLACIDIDIKDPSCKEAAETALGDLIGNLILPEVRSGSGNGSRHLYCVTEKPFPMITVEKHKDQWEICIYSTGRQMVLPPSIHPNGKPYKWKSGAAVLTKMNFTELQTSEGKSNETRRDTKRGTLGQKSEMERAFKFTPEDVEIAWLPIPDSVRDGIVSGTHVDDRSGYLLRASSALLSAGLTQNQVLSVLTDKSTFLGRCAFEHAQTKDRRRAAQWVYRYTLKEVSEKRDPTSVFGKIEIDSGTEPLSAEEIEAQSAEIKAHRYWTQDLERGGQKGDGAPKATIQNLVIIFKNAVAPAIVKRDLFALRDTYAAKTPWEGRPGDIIQDDDIANIKFWLGREYGFEPKKEVVYDALTVIACQNAYDPVRDWLDALPDWDGVERLDGWLTEHFEAKGHPAYLSQVFRKWMVAMVMRVYEPGAKFDWMPIFEGAQGVGKSSFGRLLVGDKLFLDWLPNLNDKDAGLSLQGMWGVEMGELSQFKKNELENIKAFITRTVDKMRPPYGRKLMESPRRCVFFGTTNRSTYLIDDTGNRRFKPVVVGDLNFEALRKQRRQLFAEAKWLWDNKKETERSLELDGEAREYEKKVHGEKMVEDESNVMAEAMLNFVEKVQKEEVDFNLKKFRIIDLFGGEKGGGGALGNWKYSNPNTKFAAKMLRKLGASEWPIRGRMHWKLDVVGQKMSSAPPPKRVQF